MIHDKNLVDAAVAARVPLIVWSSLRDVEKQSGSKFYVPHFTNKHRIQQYIENHPSKIPAVLVYAGYYATNFANIPSMNSPHRNPNASIEIATLLRADVCEPVIDIENDFGK